MICEICKNEFLDNRSLTKHIRSVHSMHKKEYYDKLLKKQNEDSCPICGKPTPFISFSKGYQKHCCAKCAQLDPNVNNTFRCNNPQKDMQIRHKTEQTLKDKYGGIGTASKSIADKIKITNTKKYGVENCYLRDDIQKIARQNSHTREANMRRKTAIENKVKELEIAHNWTYLQNVLHQTKSSGWYQNNIVKVIKYDNLLFVKNDDLKTIFDYDENSYRTYSVAEKRIVNAIKQIYFGKIIENSRKIIHPKELDIYLPELNTAIEYNGIYFHSDLFENAQTYHLEKSLLCREKGIRLIHVYEFEDLDKQIELIIELINGNDLFSTNDFNKNNLIEKIPEPTIIYSDGRLNVYGTGPLITM